MKTLFFTLLMLFSSFTYAQQWHITKVDYDDLFLRVTIDKDNKVDVQKFDITTEEGKLCRHIDGWTDPDTQLKTDTLTFIRGNWSLKNTWLNGNGHKEPLFPDGVVKTIPKILPIQNDPSSGLGAGSGSGQGPPAKAEKCPCNGGDKSCCSCENSCECKSTGCAKKGEGSGDSPGPSSNDKPPKKDGKGENCDSEKDKPEKDKKYIPLPPPEEKKKPNPLDENFILYLSTGDELSKGIVYQVDSNGMVLGKVSLPFTATGMTSHRDNALVCVIPRDGGRIVRIDDTGKVGIVIDRIKGIPHPIRVTMPKNSDEILVVDDILNEIIQTNMGGRKPIQFKPDEKLPKMINPSVAVVEDGRVIFQENRQVSADKTSEKWAVAQHPDKILIHEGEKLIKTLTLPSGKSIYKGGLMSWSGVGTLCVACQGQDEVPWLIMYDVEKEKIKTLFPWKNGELQSFVVAPRMRWDRKSPTNKEMKF